MRSYENANRGEKCVGSRTDPYGIENGSVLKVCTSSYLQVCTPFDPSDVFGSTFPKRVDGAILLMLVSRWLNILIFRYFTQTVRGHAVTRCNTIERFEGEIC